MSTQNISLQANVPLDGFNQLKEILSSIKDSLKELVEPLKEIGNYIKFIGGLSSDLTIKPEIDTSSLETARTVVGGLSAAAAVMEQC